MLVVIVKISWSYNGYFSLLQWCLCLFTQLELGARATEAYYYIMYGYVGAAFLFSSSISLDPSSFFLFLSLCHFLWVCLSVHLYTYPRLRTDLSHQLICQQNRNLWSSCYNWTELMIRINNHCKNKASLMLYFYNNLCMACITDWLIYYHLISCSFSWLFNNTNKS